MWNIPNFTQFEAFYAQKYQQLPFHQFTNGVLAVLSSWKVNIAKNPIVLIEL